MHIIKTSEKVLIWMHRNNITGQEIAIKIGISRQAWSKKINTNVFQVIDLVTIKSMGYKE